MPGFLRAWPIALWCLLPLGAAVAQEAPNGGDAAEETVPEEPESELPPVVERPDFMANKPVLPDLILKDKRDGMFLTGFPAIGWDAENGWVLGAFLQHYSNGERDDPFFRSTSYRSRVTVGGLFTTAGLVDLAAGLDMPYVFDSPYRVRMGVAGRYNPSNNYYGVGDDANRKLRYSGSPERFDRHEDFVDALRESPDGMTAYSRYIEFESTFVGGSIAIERDVWGGILRPLLGLRVGHTDIEDYTGERVQADSPVYGLVRAIQVSTKLREDTVAGRIDGFEGGWDNALRLGLSLDTRDFEPDPSQGFLLQATSEVSTRLLGSDFDYQRVTLSAAGYHNLLPSLTRLIVAARAVYTMSFGNVPFYSLRTFASNGLNYGGLGGFKSLRGYKRFRFVGRSMALFNLDLRWSFAEFLHEEDHFRFMVAGFLDVGRAWDDVEFDFEDWKPGYGAGFRFAWNLATIVSVDVAFSNEDSVFYVSFGHQF
jgi:hypothetical protein